MKHRVKTIASAALFAFLLALPARADDFKLGIGGGAAFTTGDLSDAYKTGWTATVRALWFPKSSVSGLRAAGYYGQYASQYPEFFGLKPAAIYGLDANFAVRLTGKGADGLYVFAGPGFRSLHQRSESPYGSSSQTDTALSLNGGLGYSFGMFFVEANAVYFRVREANLWSVPVTVGFQF